MIVRLGGGVGGVVLSDKLQSYSWLRVMCAGGWEDLRCRAWYFLTGVWSVGVVFAEGGGKKRWVLGHVRCC